MVEAWLNFTVVVFAQFLIFIAYAYYAKKLSDVPRMFGLGALVAIVVGLPFDLLVGKLFGFHSFALGFGLFFLIVNAVFSYGLFVSNILLMQNVKLRYFFLWVIVLVLVYEITNYFFSVWTWEFTLPHFAFLVVLIVGYFGGAVLAAGISHVFLGRRFLFIDHLLKK
jgi:hypothetical protein